MWWIWSTDICDKIVFENSAHDLSHISFIHLIFPKMSLHCFQNDQVYHHHKQIVGNKKSASSRIAVSHYVRSECNVKVLNIQERKASGWMVPVHQIFTSNFLAMRRSFWMVVKIQRKLNIYVISRLKGSKIFWG